MGAMAVSPLCVPFPFREIAESAGFAAFRAAEVAISRTVDAPGRTDGSTGRAGGMQESAAGERCECSSGRLVRTDAAAVA